MFQQKSPIEDCNGPFSPIGCDVDGIIKVLLIGNSSVGKSCMLARYSEGEFPEGQKATIGIDFKLRQLDIDGRIVKLQIWDTAGQEQFANIVRSYLRKLDAIIYVFDLTDYNSLKSLNKWITEVNFFNKNKNIVTILAGNKLDLKNEYQVSKSEIKSFNSQYNMKYVETSIKNIDSLNNLFLTLIKEVYKNIDNLKLKEIKPYKEKVIVNQEIDNKKCCNYL